MASHVDMVRSVAVVDHADSKGENRDIGNGAQHGPAFAGRCLNQNIKAQMGALVNADSGAEED